ncbi:MAG: nitrogen fixation protein NifQ [Desulfuromonadales bacterium]
MTGYTETIRRWATDTRRAGILPNADGTGEVGLDSEEIGRRLAVRFTLKVEGERVTDIRYQVFGCGFSMAACALAAELSVGTALEEIQAIDAKRLDTALSGLPAERDYCAELAVQALHAAVLSARNGRQPVQTSAPQKPDHGARVTAEDPVYAALLNTPQPDRATAEDRHLYACLLAIAAHEPYGPAAALGLEERDLAAILAENFPGAQRSLLEQQATRSQQGPPASNHDVLSILMSHVPESPDDRDRQNAVRLAHILAARAAHPGHLWVAMGLFERPQLSAAISRHLPTLAAANHQNMRWKRYLYKQACDRNGGTLCKAPNCGVCSDYALCFVDA